MRKIGVLFTVVMGLRAICMAMGGNPSLEPYK